MNNLIIENLHVKVDNKEIIKGVNLKISNKDCIALIGPNGQGKSTLFLTIMGHPKCIITNGTIKFNNKNILKLSTDERSKLGIFLGLQNPIEVPGVMNIDFLRNILNVRNKKPISLIDFYDKIKTIYKEVDLSFDMINRNLNEGFSGGEKKKNEILQMLIINTKLAMLDEIDSGLDVDAINMIAKILIKKHQNGMGLFIISHYNKLLDLIKPNRVIIMIDGKIVFEGDNKLIEYVNKNGYEWIKNTKRN